MGRYYYMLTCGLIAGLVLGGLFVDMVLATEENQSITAWLRLHPKWYWYPTCGMILVLLTLGIHLFGNGR
jgi:hypothetical protein